MGQDAYFATCSVSRITITVEFKHGPYCEDLVHRARRAIVEELIRNGNDITTVQIELDGQIASW